jgi:hypothetical protein
LQRLDSIFEYTNQRPMFGLYAPILAFFVFTGIHVSHKCAAHTSHCSACSSLTEECPCTSQVLLWYKAVQTANGEAEEQDRKDKFL